MTENHDEKGLFRKTARVYRQSVLERYASAGWLDFGDGRYSALDRVGAGNRLYTDFYLAGLDNCGAVDLSRIRVDGGGSGGSEKTVAGKLWHQDNYEKALASVPEEFWPVVRRVCIDDLPIEVRGTRLDVKRCLYAGRIDLCRGLDRLVDFYFHRRG